MHSSHYASIFYSLSLSGSTLQQRAVTIRWGYQTSITVEVKEEGEYVLQWKELPAYWEEPASVQSKKINTADAKKFECEGLLPGTTYTIRLEKDGETGPDLVVDTEQVSCAPQGNCCTIQ